MRAKKLSRVIGFAFVVALMGGIGATAWAGTDEQPSAPAPAVVESPSPTVAPPAPSVHKIRTKDFSWN